MCTCIYVRAFCFNAVIALSLQVAPCMESGEAKRETAYGEKPEAVKTHLRRPAWGSELLTEPQYIPEYVFQYSMAWYSIV